MSYTDVYNIIQQANNEEISEETRKNKKYEKYTREFLLMEELAEILKAKRAKDGSLELDVPESKIILDENGVAIDVKNMKQILQMK